MKKKVIAIYLISAILLSTKSTAQDHIPIDSLKSLYQNETLRFSSGQLFKGTNEEKIPYSKMQDEFTISIEGMKEFQSHKKTNAISRIFLLSSVAATVVAATQYRTNKDLGFSFLVGSFVLNYINLFIRRSARKKMEEAVWLRNRDLLFK